jgi:hypothetical protein
MDKCIEQLLKVPIANEYVKKCWTPLAIKEMQIKSTL